MEETKKVNLTNKNIATSDDGGTHIPGCSFWIFGDKDSADNDLKEKFEIVDDAKKD